MLSRIDCKHRHSPGRRTCFLLDTNVFIEAHRRYYALDLCPGFWECLSYHARQRNLSSIDKVQAEIRVQLSTPERASGSERSRRDPAAGRRVRSRASDRRADHQVEGDGPGRQRAARREFGQTARRRMPGTWSKARSNDSISSTACCRMAAT